MDYALRKYHIRNAVLDALGRHGIPHDHPMRAELEANATIAAGDPSHVIMKNGNSLDVEIRGRLNSPRMDESLPAPSRTLPKNDTDGLRKYFDDIAAGRVTVR